MKILLINHYAGSVYHGMEFRPYYMAREWVRSGHEVTVVGATFSHLRQKNVEADKRVTEEYIDGIRYVWLKTPPYKGNGFGRIRNMLSFISGLYGHMDLITRGFKPDAVVASSTYPLDAYPAHKAAKKFGAKFVFEVHDLWPMSPMVLGNMSKHHPFIVAMQRAEDYWCRNTDLVVSFLPDAHKHLTTRGMTMDKYVVIPNGVSPEEWEGEPEIMPESHKSVVDGLKAEGKFLVAYLGSHGIANGINYILELAEKLSGHRDIYFLLVGSGPQKELAIEEAGRLGLNNIKFMPPLAKKYVRHFLSSMNVLIHCPPANELTQYGVSQNKIFDYMMSSTPVVWACSTSNDIVGDAGCGFTLESGDMDGTAEKILTVKSMPDDERKEMGRRGREYILKNYTYPVLAGKFIEALER